MLSPRSLCVSSFVAITALSSIALGGGAHLPKVEVPKVAIATNVMYGVDGPFVGSASPLRGISGDSLPWESPSMVDAKLTTDGFLFIAVRGLVLGGTTCCPRTCAS